MKVNVNRDKTEDTVTAMLPLGVRLLSRVVALSGRAKFVDQVRICCQFLAVVLEEGCAEAASQ